MDLSLSFMGEFDMRKMKAPEMDIIRFNESDVIVASGSEPVIRTITLSGMDDNGKGNGRYSFDDGRIFTTASSDRTALGNALVDYFGASSTNPNFVALEKSNFYSVTELNNYDQQGMDRGGTSNGTYIWAGNNFQQQ